MPATSAGMKTARESNHIGTCAKMGDLLFKLARPALFFLDPERAHGVSIRALKFGFARTMPRRADDQILATKVWSLAFPNPVGLAAGFDKHAEVCDAALGLGFGFVEAGTVTPRPQPGNSGQRLYRLTEDEAVINRFGFNSQGLAPFVANLARRRARPGIVGANVGKNRDTTDSAADYIAGIEAVGLLRIIWSSTFRRRTRPGCGRCRRAPRSRNCSPASRSSGAAKPPACAHPFW